MDSIVTRYCKFMLLVALLVEAQNSSSDQPISESQQARTIGRVVKLYAGYKPEPVNCIAEGFLGDPKDCGIFYRCIKSGKGKFTVFKFQCAPGTVYDPDTEICNYPRSTKRLECGGFSNEINEIDEDQQELPSPIVTKAPMYTERTTIKLNSENKHDVTNKNPLIKITEKEVLNTATIPTSASVTNTPYSLDKLTSSSTIHSLPITMNSHNLHPNLQKNLCTLDGFMGDYENCHKFYRCVGNGIGGFTKYEFSCSDSTVWDDDIQACNHPWAVKKSRCKSKSKSKSKSGSNFDSTKVVDNLHQSTFTENLNYLDYYGNNTNLQEQVNYASNVNKVENQSAHQSGEQNEIQISYGDRINKLEKPILNQNNKKTNKTSAVIQIIAENNVMPLQSQINFANQLSQTLVSDSTTIRNSFTSYYINKNEDLSNLNLEKIDECTHTGFMDDSNNCKKFYRCVDNGKGGYTKHEFSCGEGTLWDKKLETCNHAWLVNDCESKHSLVETDFSTATSTMKSTLNDITPIQTIENHSAMEETDYNNGNVNYNNLDGIALGVTPIYAIATTLPNDLLFANNECRSSGFMGDTMNCKIFYRCVDDGKGGYTKYKFECGEDTLWDSDIEACNHAAAVENCGRNVFVSTLETSSKDSSVVGNSTTETSHTVTTLSQTNIVSPSTEFEGGSELHNSPMLSPTGTISQNTCKSVGFIGDKNNCKKFYRCVDNGDGSFKRYEFLCGDGTVWDQKINGCNHAKAVEKCGGNNDMPDNHYLNSPEHNTYRPSEESESNIVHNKSSTQSSTIIIPTAFTEYYNSTEDSSKSTASDNPLTPSGVCRAEGFFGDATNCKKFYRCVDNGKGNFNKHEFICGDGTIWNGEITACDHESSNNKCVPSFTEYSNYTTEHQQILEEVYSSTTTIQKEDTYSTHKNQLPSSYRQCLSEGFHADPSDCKKFYRCVQNYEGGFTKYDFSCGEGTIWNHEIQACDHDIGNTNCSKQNESAQKQPDDSQPSSTPSAITSITTTLQFVLPSENNDKISTEEGKDCISEGYYGDTKDCRKFYRCVDNGNGELTKYDFSCGEGTAWDEDIKGCNHIHLVESCQTSSTISEIKTDEVVYTSTMTTATVQESNSTESNENSSWNCEDSCSEEGYFGNTNDCTKFYRCVDDGNNGLIKYDFNCGEGTIWDQDISACNHPGDVTNPSCQNSSDTNSTTDCSTITTTISTTTQSSTSTSQHSEQLPNSTQEETSKKPVNNNFTCTEAGFFPNPYDCKKFYRCVDWDNDGSRFSIFHFECGEGTIWDPKLKTCNYEESVNPPRDCSGAQPQTENSAHGTLTTEATTYEEITTKQTVISNPQTTTPLSTQKTSQQSTTQKSTTSDQTTTQKPTTTYKTTTQESTTSIVTTSEQTTVSQQPITTTTQTTIQTTTNNAQSTITEETTTQQSITTEEPKNTTEMESTTKESTTQTSTDSSIAENTTTQKSTTEQNTQQTTDNQVPTTEHTTVTEQVGTTESSATEGSVTTAAQSSTESSTEKGDQETTTESSSTSAQKCPETDDDQYLFVCPTSFRRHPKYCNLFYQCTEDDDTRDAKIAVFTCPNNTIYDESKIQCVEEEKAENSCDGEIASRRRVKRLGFHYKDPIVVTTGRHSCATTGHLPFEKNSECSPAFLKCEKSKSGKLRGYVYQCPQNYIYWSISRKCERKENVRDCKRTINNWNDRWEIPVEKHNVAW